MFDSQGEKIAKYKVWYNSLPYRERIIEQEKEWDFQPHFPMGVNEEGGGPVMNWEPGYHHDMCFLCPEDWPCERSIELGVDK